MANVIVVSETPQRVIIRDQAATRTVKVVAQGPQGPSGNVNPLMFQMLDQAQAAASSASASANTAGDHLAATSIRADEAASSAASALASEQVSTTNATSAAQSAASASASATTAISSASSASLSASSANTSATNAQASANTATSKASEAATSATAAQGAAAGVQANAEASASSAAAAAASQSAAATSANNASNSATAAAGSAIAASNSATAAAGSATSASTSATNAATSATQAANSAASALQAKNDAIAALGTKLDVNAAQFGGNAASATKLATARTLTVGSTGKAFDGTANVGFTLTEIGAAAAAHSHAITDVSALALPDIKPSLLLDFANTRRLDSRITFTRASTATYWDGKTFAKAEENLLLRSQEFDNSYWGKSSSTVSANATAAPDGSMTADTVSLPSNLARIERAVSGLSTSTHTFSIHIKGTPGETVNVEIGAVGQTVTLSGSWQRVSVSSSGSASHTVSVIRRDTTAASVEIWGAQLEQRDQATAYTLTTDQPITRYQPVLQVAAANVPRFDHNPVTGESLGLLVEEQRTNLFTYSDQFNNAVWVKSDATVSANAIVSPDGTIDAEKLVEGTANSLHFLHYVATLASSTSYTLSVFAKAGERTRFQIAGSGSSWASYSAATFDLSAGTVVANTGAFTSASITPVGNGWYRCTVTGLSNASPTNQQVAQFLLVQSGTTVTYTGNGFSGIYIWGAQLEAGAFPTSYIPTTTAQVTRTADAAVMTGANFSSWCRQDEGAFVSEAAPSSMSATNMCVVAATDGTDNNVIGCFADAGYNLYVYKGGATQAALSSGAYSAGAFSKNAASYSLNAFAASLNSGAVASDSSGLVPSLSQLWIGVFTNNYRLNGHIRKIAYYPKRLSNAELQALTA